MHVQDKDGLTGKLKDGSVTRERPVNRRSNVTRGEMRARQITGPHHSGVR